MDRSVGRITRSLGTCLILYALAGLGLCSAQVGANGDAAKDGIPADWSFRHIVHSRRIDHELERATSHEPRVIYEWWRRNGAARLRAANRTAGEEQHRRERHERVDWNFPLGGGTVAYGMSPAKYSFNIATADCTNDYVEFALNVAGSAAQPNLVRLNKIYSGTGGLCGNDPALLSAYSINTFDLTGLNLLNGKLLTSPTLSLDGTKTAFIETVTANTRICPGLLLPSTCSIFHVLTWGTTGNNGSYDKINGAYTAVAPGSPANNATLTTVTYSAQTTTSSSPWIDYSSDRSYFGDDNGRLYSTTCTFKCPTGLFPQIAIGWPITVAAGVRLSAPVYDSGTNKIFVGGVDGNLYMVDLTACPGIACSIASVQVGSTATHGGVLDGPIVDSTFQTVFAFAGASNTGGGVIFQTNESLDLAPNIILPMGNAAGFDIYDGALSDVYFNNALGGAAVSGTLFSCGPNGGSLSPSLYWSNFTKNAGNLSLTNPPRLSTSTSRVNIPGNPGTGCSPLTEFANGSTDRLFFSQPVLPANKCGPGASDGCVFMYNITNPATIGNAPNAFLREHAGTSAIVIDGVSTSPQASSIYFANQAATVDPCWTGPSTSKVVSYCAFKLTQSALQ